LAVDEVIAKKTGLRFWPTLGRKKSHIALKGSQRATRTFHLSDQVTDS